MARFRVRKTGAIVEMGERWAEHLRASSKYEELGDNGEPVGDPTPAPVSKSELNRVRKADLQQMLRDANKDVDESWGKAELIERVRALQDE